MDISTHFQILIALLLTPLMNSELSENSFRDQKGNDLNAETIVNPDTF